MKKVPRRSEEGMLTVITNARVFDGENVIDSQTVVIDGGYVHSVGGMAPTGATLIDAHGATLIPGLIDAHVHTDLEGLREALLFGVTTELEMMGYWTAQERKEVAERDDIADVRSPGMGITPPGGHPTEYMPDSDDERMRDYAFPFVSTPDEAAKRIAALVAEGADYIKIFMEDGTALGIPGLPMLSNETLLAAVREAHRYGKMAIAHSTTAATTQQVITAGVDGLAHLFVDPPHNFELVAAIAASGAFVTPCLTLNSSVMGNTGAALAADERVRSRLSKKWLDSLCGSMNTYPQGSLEDVFATVAALEDVGVDILAGTDVSEPLPNLGGLAHGASLHHELQLLVAAGLTPIEALQAATATPARRFGLTDRGRIAPEARADLLLIDGDPTTNIADTLSIRAIWRRGVRLTEEVRKIAS
jgi:imidazolonepropionase-like amidohydrolase